jgi:transposase InsO family protein
VADITYIPTDEGRLYPAAVMDLYSRRIAGWAMSERVDREVPLRALHAHGCPAPSSAAGADPPLRPWQRYASHDY